MALFTFTDLKPAQVSPTVRAALGVDDREPLLARRLRGSGKYDRGRRAVEIIVPARLPQEVNLRAGGLLGDNLDFAAPHFKYGEYYQGDLRDEFAASEAVVLHEWQCYEGPEYAPDPDAPDGLRLISETEDEHFHNFAVLAFFDPPSWRETLRPLTRPYHAVRRAYRASRPGDQWWRNIGRI
jgi:hypothetical protein